TRCRSTSAHVGWTTNTSVPRMFSSIWNETSVSGNRCRRACPTETCRNSAISSVSALFALPEKILSWFPPVVGSAPVVITQTPLDGIGAGGFEPPNTGSKVPRLTAWPRPSRAPQASWKTLSVTDLAFTGNPEAGGARPALVLGAAEGAGDQRPRAVTRQRFNG